MSLPKVLIYRRNGGLGRAGDDERQYSALCMNGAAVTGGVQLNTVYELNSLNDAVDLGIDADYDTDNTMLCYYHISEFFRMCPTGKLFILIVAQTVTLTQMADKTSTNGLAQLLRDPLCKGKVRQAAVARNPASGYTPVTDGGLDSDSLAYDSGTTTYSGAVVKAHALATEEQTLYRPVHIFVEGRSLNGTTAALFDATGANCSKVQLVVLADNDVSTADTLYAGYAAVGTVLGLRAGLSSANSLAFVALGNIQSQADSKFVNPGLSSGTKLSAYTDTVNGDQDVLYDKGFIAPRIYQGYDGVYLNSDRTCVVNTDDYARGALNMVINEADRLVYLTMLPKLEGDYKVNASNGRLAPIIIKSWEADCNKALGTLVGTEDDNTGDVSAAGAFINPNQNFLSTDTIVVEHQIVPKGYAKTIKNYIGFKNPFNS
jgi:hypothetical protein